MILYNPIKKTWVNTEYSNIKPGTPGWQEVEKVEPSNIPQEKVEPSNIPPEKPTEELSPIGKAVIDKLEPAGDFSKDLTIPLAKKAEETISKETKDYILKQPDWQDLFDKALEAGGMKDIKSEVEKIQTEVSRIIGKYDEDIGKIAENPFMSASTKQRNINRLKALTNAELRPLISQYEKLKDRTAEIVRGAERTLGFMEKSYQFASTERERMRQEEARIRDDARAIIQQYISSGALGEFSDEELQDIANWGVGYDYNSLKKLQSAVKQGSDLKIRRALTDLESKAQAMEIKGEQLRLAKERLELSKERLESTKEGKINKLTIDEAVKLGLPLSLVGRSEKEIMEDFDSSIPPLWFKEVSEKKLQSSIVPSKLQGMWEEFKTKITTPKEEEIKIENPFRD